jgi:hypothetical protein
VDDSFVSVQLHVAVDLKIPSGRMQIEDEQKLSKLQTIGTLY